MINNVCVEFNHVDQREQIADAIGAVGAFASELYIYPIHNNTSCSARSSLLWLLAMNKANNVLLQTHLAAAQRRRPNNKSRDLRPHSRSRTFTSTQSGQGDI